MTKTKSGGNDAAIREIERKAAAAQAEAAAKAQQVGEAKEVAGHSGDDREIDTDPALINPPDPPLSAEAEAEADRIMNSDEGANQPEYTMASADDPALRRQSIGFSPEQHSRATNAVLKLRNIALDFPLTTPNEHIVFGRASFMFTVGDLRDMFPDIPR